MAEGMRPEIDLTSNLQTFFHDVVGDALREKRLSATEAAEYYLVTLLADYVRPDPLTHETLERPLTLLLDEALHAPGGERFERLRTLGDGVLYVSGFFSEHLETRGVEVSYVRQLGARAYDGAGKMLRSAAPKESAPDLFFELSERFEDFVAVLTSVAERLHASSAGASKQAVLKVYERWLKTGSSALGAELMARGLAPVRSGGGLH